ncbi:MAG: hypothetical protein HY892_08275 [Deltaproteobacteria bacterium]|nr:hypothetical protein [Deltaproteobacteria bacterium]
MILTSMKRCKLTRWLLVPVIAGLIFPTIPVTRAFAAPVFPIQTPDDARSWGLDSLGNLMRSPSGDYPVQSLVLNPNFKVPLPQNLGDFVKDRTAALVLGKALFWDMQVGSDGIQACATCHFQAGADVRSKNQVVPQGNQVKYQRNGEIIGFFNAPKPGTDTFEEVDGRLWAPNFQLEGMDFPLVLTQNAFLPSNPNFGDTIAADTDAKNRNDVVGSMGLMKAQFDGVMPGHPVDKYKGTLGTMRQTTGRNAPPSVNAIFNLLQFWDGRADTEFNGFNPIGRHDNPKPKYFVNDKGKLKERVLNLKPASLASQSVGPPLSDVEMSFAGRTWPDIGKKLTRDGLMKPLAYQLVHPKDSVLGLYSNSPDPGLKNSGLTSSYKALVQAAFKDELWNIDSQSLTFRQAKLKRTTPDELIYLQGPYVIESTSRRSKTLPAGYTQMEANFSLFWGIAVMLYEAELVSEQSRFDKWMEDPHNNPLTPAELDGLNVFVNQGKCIACHSGPEFTNATVRNTKNGKEQIEPIRKANGDPAFYDNGFYNVGMTPTVDDIQRGDKDPNGKPWGNSRQFLFQANNIMNIPFKILGLPIQGLEARINMAGQQELWKVLFDLVTGEKTDEFLVCIDLDRNNGCDLNDQIVIETLDQDGNCKASSVRNVELNGPYFHNGGAATLQQILDNYDIGGKFRKDILNKVDMLPDITRLGLADASTPNGTNAEEALVAFILALTDHRVKTEKAPFDHPQLFIPLDGTAPMLNTSSGNGPVAWNAWLVSQTGPGGLFEEDIATGATGLTGDLKPFLDLDPFAGDTGKGGIIEVGSD